MQGIIIRGCAYLANCDKDGYKTEEISLNEGWVIVGIVGEMNGVYRIPSSYKDLPIIGLVSEAYESMKEYYREESARETFNPYLIFEGAQPLFVMPAPRRSGKPKIYPWYHVSESKSYRCNFFTPDTSLSSAKNLLEVMGREDYLYSALGEIDLSIEERTKDGRRLGKKEYPIDLPIDSSPDKMKKHKVGKYLYNPEYRFEFEEITPFFDERKSVFAWVKRCKTRKESEDKTMLFAFNTIPGTDEFVECKGR